MRILKRGRNAGDVDDYTDQELEVIVHILMGARGYLSRQYAYTEGSAHAVPDYVISAYEKLLGSGLFRRSGERDKPNERSRWRLKWRKSHGDDRRQSVRA